jgi:hypothetical protein
MRVIEVAEAGSGPLELREREIPEPAWGEARVSVQACGICHSDSYPKEGHFPGVTYPVVPGHEVACHRAAVLTALDVIGYERPTHLRVRRARMVGLVLPELQNPIFPALAEVVGGALAQRGFNAVLCTRTGSTSEAEYVEMLLERQVSGVVFAGAQYAEADAPHRPSARSTRSAV